MTERELVKAAIEGDESIFWALYEIYKEKIYRTACLLTGNSADADDISQETWIIAYNKIGALKDPGKFSSWIYVILKRCAFRYLKRKRSEVLVDEITEFQKKEIPFEAASPTGTPMSNLLQTEREDILQRCVLSLDKKQRMVIILFYYNDFSIEQISEIMHAPPGTIKSRLHTARENLRIALQKEGLTYEDII